ncbi:MAG: hypothetical protein Q7V62_02570, partial [Actinomycetota bacterium]|nr:hypothetical protein [Actinomycetota bacterium]
FVADGSGGLQIVNYVAFDTQGVAPVVSIVVDGVDADPATPGVQVLEGRSLRVLPTITDDVQLRNVELLVNGQVVSNDVSFPFELFTQVPTRAEGGNQISVQVRATDSGGNVTLSAAVLLQVVPDTFAPQITTVSLVDAARLFFVRSVDIGFDEPIDIARLASSGVTLLRAGTDGLFDTADDVAYPFHLDTRSFGQAVSVVIDAVLPAGEYRFRLDPSIIADRAGNALTTPIERSFTIRPASDVKAAIGVPAIPTAPSANPGQQIGIGVPFDPATAKMQFSVVDASGNVTNRVVSVLRTNTALGLAYFQVPMDAVTGDAVVYSLVGAVRTDFTDGSFPLQVVPTVSSIQIEYLNGDGTAQ